MRCGIVCTGSNGGHTVKSGHTMNWVHLHLALNHIPVFGSLFVLIVLVIGLIKRSDELKRTSLWLFFVLVLISIPIKFTGDFAYEKTSDEAWMSTPIAEAHEEAADQATTGVFLLGITAALGLFRGRGKRTIPTWVYATTLILAVATFVLTARTANLGGQIRHTEIRAAERTDC
jgi:uncharacterized membrane protein